MQVLLHARQRWKTYVSDQHAVMHEAKRLAHLCCLQVPAHRLQALVNLLLGIFLCSCHGLLCCSLCRLQLSCMLLACIL